ncbi:hypothetical protein [uncultured Parabacteroides sp.]|mgnify:CR=1 FL=1|jgi:hypothetical protein|uniref:hypothetical protein n=1 Tax=uncultured Parabacteroides sp. TaxID=512312 RepID=UPI0025FE34A4|nr:hypothetical protein [uncultured Parabacteroides sp.]
MDKKYVQDVYDYLNEQYKEYYFATKKAQKNMVEDRVRLFSHGLKDELYLTLNEGHASGLFEHGFFESDLLRSLKVLKDTLEE